MQAAAQLGEIRGIGEIRDKDGNLKCTFELRAPTDLTAEEFERQLASLPVELEQEVK